MVSTTPWRLAGAAFAQSNGGPNNSVGGGLGSAIEQAFDDRMNVTITSTGWSLIWLVIAIAVGLVLRAVVFRLLPGVIRRFGRTPRTSVLDRFRRPSMLLLPLLVIQLFMPTLNALPRVGRHVLTLLMFAAVVWMVVAAISAIERTIKTRYDVSVPDNLEARRIHTQLSVLARSAMVIVVIIGTGAALMTFPNVRALGTAMLASAGLAGLVVGFAARPVLENLIAGLQIALTQPIRIDDVVVIDGEWGRIEEITMAYVVVRIWDQRRLVVPLSKVIGDSFQNWTRKSADILGTVFLYTDYTVPVQPVREELERLCRSSDLWDGRVCVLQVTDATERTMQMRALVSAKDSSTAWDLRVWLREQLIDFLQRNYRDSLPRSRVESPGESSSQSTRSAEAADTDAERAT